jgi:hypothetical protein
MAKKELNELTIEELKQRAKSIKIVTWFLVVMLNANFTYSTNSIIPDCIN